MPTNKPTVTFGLSNVHTAGLTKSGSTYTYEAWEALPGAVNCSGSDNSNEVREYADNKTWYLVSKTTDATVTLEMERVTDEFLIDYCSYIRSKTGGLLKTTNKARKKFALGFRNETDADHELHVWPECQVTGSVQVEHATNEDGVTINHATVTITAFVVSISDNTDIIMDDITADDSRFAGLWSAVYALPEEAA